MVVVMPDCSGYRDIAIVAVLAWGCIVAGYSTMRTYGPREGRRSDFGILLIAAGGAIMIECIVVFGCRLAC